MRAENRRVLLVFSDLKPNLDQPDAAVDHEFFDGRTEVQEAFVLLLGAEAHDVFDAGAVVPTAIENHDFTGGWKSLDVALQVQLGFLAIGRSGEGDDAKYPRAHPFGDGFDGPALSGGITSFEQYDDAHALLSHPILQMAELHL